MKKEKELVGIWGFGIVGKAAAKHFYGAGKKISILDHRMLNMAEQELITHYQASYLQTNNTKSIALFLQSNDYTLVSPGIDIRPLHFHNYTFLAELDLFAQNFTKPTIAITGSVGKTTITTIISHIIQKHSPGWWTGGNIGISVLDAIEHQENIRGAIIEISSFQLEYCKQFCPTQAIITNIYENHLDRHGSFTDYIQAKTKIGAYQKNGQILFAPLTLKQFLPTRAPGTITHFFAHTTPHEQEYRYLSAESLLFYHDNISIYVRKNGIAIPLIRCDELPTCSFLQNWLIIVAFMYANNIPLTLLQGVDEQLSLPAHRLEKIATINDIDFYNDSKGTTMAATYAAVQKLKKKPIILLLGGISKGVNRTPLLKDLSGDVRMIICFGQEKEFLQAACKQYHITSFCAETLDHALYIATDHAMAGDQIILSPAGASFDQFTHYQERGDHFTQWVKLYQKKYSGTL